MNFSHQTKICASSNLLTGATVPLSGHFVMLLCRMVLPDGDTHCFEIIGHFVGYFIVLSLTTTIFFPLKITWLSFFFYCWFYVKVNSEWVKLSFLTIFLGFLILCLAIGKYLRISVSYYPSSVKSLCKPENTVHLWCSRCFCVCVKFKNLFSLWRIVLCYIKENWTSI